jgi:two-component system, OmpR family, response regulator MprA
VEHIVSGNPHVLVIDDDVSTRQVYRDALEEEGYRVTLLTSPDLEPEGGGTLVPDLILLDLRFRHQANGVRFLERLKGDPTTRPIPVLVCSAALQLLEDLYDPLAAWDCGALPKPFGLEELLAAVRARVGQSSGVGIPTKLPSLAGT